MLIANAVDVALVAPAANVIVAPLDSVTTSSVSGALSRLAVIVAVPPSDSLTVTSFNVNVVASVGSIVSLTTTSTVDAVFSDS